MLETVERDIADKGGLLYLGKRLSTASWSHRVRGSLPGVQRRLLVNLGVIARGMNGVWFAHICVPGSLLTLRL